MLSLHTTIITLSYTDILLSSDVIILAIRGWRPSPLVPQPVIIEGYTELVEW
jgi:hypothetical protein